MWSITWERDSPSSRIRPSIAKSSFSPCATIGSAPAASANTRIARFIGSSPDSKPPAPEPPAPKVLVSRPLRFSLRKERLDALVEVVARVAQLDEIRIVAGSETAFLEHTTDHFLGRAQRQRGVRGDVVGEAVDGRTDLVRRGNPVDEPDRVRFNCVDQPAGEHQIFHDRRPGQIDETAVARTGQAIAERPRDRNAKA